MCSVPIQALTFQVDHVNTNHLQNSPFVQSGTLRMQYKGHAQEPTFWEELWHHSLGGRGGKVPNILAAFVL